MKIGIDISQSIYEGTGVGEYTVRLVEKLLEIDEKNEYMLFFSNRKKFSIFNFQFSKNPKIRNTKYQIRIFRIPIQLLEFLWNRLHVFPIEWLIGDIDIFLSSDWLEPPTVRAKKITTIHDLSVLKFPDSYDKKIKSVHTRKLQWALKECDAILCDSEATKRDAMELLGIEKNKLHVVYLGI
ncbi:MAG: group 1 glycosyl transferase [Microgenomates group bacterium GW2011_GWC1_41_8]|uniref:Glycosyl transferase group 1 n=3 Tax=Candidatus Roizmaniibacteriota TaxID=1752723 RepID=A0A0G1A7R0_9BACT|nr:MAG: Glycosyl transferase group 1 [Candidatus Roizmanbacteria bacterium GW2011_GWB1_40_7]KKR94231.1 MAG: Glycosyl transferase group 1 [Candidatus Roizmanbacteria bacterium GW2011_GWA1_41_13]KKS21363.1 MAG: Glycosyl transferase group 1 [Candidatus Roizmanbacteria bacterium GW2011_GWC2_41_7]KKS24763.1 MAG: group 1 glycosyl transferase [Microgenomates group bacterium GW2011_GWC1_41_8]OGK48495.1 MAG: hypothetical protein A3A55_04720 [Candidatus Roizmanbacteria bacterium RIFCSPLOWO2_01_FULL_40_14